MGFFENLFLGIETIAESIKDDALTRRDEAEIRRQEAKKNSRYLDPERLMEEYERQQEQMKLAKEKAIKEAGIAGEKEVDYALKWLDKRFKVFDKENRKIELKNEIFSDESQEIDHIIVCNYGVIIIETKHLAGTIIIDEAGNWSRIKNGQHSGLKNPLQQVRRHEKLIKSIIPKGIPVISYICISNDKAVLQGVENSKIPVVKVDSLVEKIENSRRKTVLDGNGVRRVMNAIKKHRV